MADALDKQSCKIKAPLLFSDEQLIARLRAGDSGVTDLLMEKYKGMVRKKARSLYILGGDREDLMQEGMIGLFKAIGDYDSSLETSFHTFADLCVTRQMYTAIESAGRKKHSPLNSYISLYERVTTPEGEEGDTIGDLLYANETQTPEDAVIAKEDVLLLQEAIQQVLSAFEKQVLELWLEGLGSGEIARLLSKEAKSTDNALNRAKRKLRNHLSKQQDF